MKHGKWFPDLTPAMPAADAARTVLAARLRAVRRCFARATSGEAVAEDIHQLRVATRRAAAAVKMFGPLLAKKPARRARRVLRAVRQAAGGPRDFDVFGDRLARTATTPAGYALAGYAAGRRAAAGVDLIAAGLACGKKLTRVCDRTPTTIDRDTSDTLATLALAALTSLFARLSAAAADPPTAPAELHAVRIIGKSVRYAMELFAACFDPPFRAELYAALGRLQEILGTLQDGDVALVRLREAGGHLAKSRPEWADDVAATVAAAAADIEARSVAVGPEFEAWATAWLAMVERHPLAGMVRRR